MTNEEAIALIKQRWDLWCPCPTCRDSDFRAAMILALAAITDVVRLREIIPKQGAAIEHQRKHAHNIDRARSRWRNRAEVNEREIGRLWEAIAQQGHYIEQSIAELFPEQFPTYPDDWLTTDLCVGDHTPESLVLQACNEIRRLRTELKECYRDGGCP